MGVMMKVSENALPGEIGPLRTPKPTTVAEYEAEIGRLTDRNRELYFALCEAWRREGRWEAHLAEIRDRLGVREDSRKLGPIIRAIDRDIPDTRTNDDHINPGETTC
jgi:hypothetical protein